MALTILQNDITTMVSEQSVNDQLVSTMLGVNVKLTNDDATETFVGVVSKMDVKIQNESDAIYTGITLEGMTHLGVKKTIALKIDDLNSDDYGGYTKFFYTKTLNEMENAIIYYEADHNLVTDKDILVFDTASVVVGNLIVYRTAEGAEVQGLVAAVAGDSVTVNVLVNGKASTVKLTLVQATSEGFIGSILIPVFDE